MSANKSIEMSNKNVPMKIKQLNIDELNFGDVSTNKNGGKFTNLQLSGNPFKLQMPNLKTWGIKMYEDQNNPSQAPKYSLNLVFNKQEIETDSKVKEALNKLEELQEKVKEMLREDSKTFFNKKQVSADYIDACFTPFVVKSKDKETQDPDDRYSSIKVKLNLQKKDDQFTDNFMAKLWTSKKEKLHDEVGNEITVKNYEKFSFGTEAKAVIQPGMIWFIGNKCGVTWNLIQAMVDKLVQRGGNEECIIQDSSDDENDDSESESESDSDTK